MKKILVITIVLFLSACKPGPQDAIKYNEIITQLVDSLYDHHISFIGQLDGHNNDSLKLVHKAFSERAGFSLDRIKKLGPFAGQKDFRTAATEYFAALDHIVNNEGATLVKLISKDSTQYTLEDYEQVTLVSERFDAIYEKAYAKLAKSQVVFSKQWGFQIDTVNTRKR